MDFGNVYIYEPGKADWMAYGLPIERGAKMGALAGDAVERDVPRCRRGDSIDAARLSAYERGLDMCPVVNADDVVVGLCTRSSLHAHPSVGVELVMEPGPMTVRPSMPLAKALEIMEQKKMRTLLVTTPDGKLLGYLSRRAAALAIHGDGEALSI